MSELSVLNRPIAGASAWVRTGIRPEDWQIELDAACLDEIRRTIDELRAYPLPTIVLTPQDFDLPACRRAMARTRAILTSGVRFAIVDRLPLDEITASEATAIYWLLSSMVARPVAQKLDGTLIYDVLDTGQQASPGSGVRPDKTNIEIRFHNDNAYNQTPPDYVGLLCLRRSMSGGHSRVISFHTAHNEMLARYPERLGRLYEPFWFDRQREFHTGESPIFAAPVFDDDGELRARFSVHQINSGYAMKGDPVDPAGAASLNALLEICEDEALSIDFDLEPGQVQFVHNRALGHSRTAFVDHPDPGQKRHLVRLWLRDRGRRAYPG
ncbi:MAG: TauD/TfdA family dioxygenase [Alphaproteobacteria bacterium]|nr:TauD/TfdA family dioxygenase [Alphaproteobacteria bacterium]